MGKTTMDLVAQIRNSDATRRHPEALASLKELKRLGYTLDEVKEMIAQLRISTQKEITIPVSEVVDNPSCPTLDDGRKIHKLIFSALKQNRKVVVSFRNMSALMPEFLTTTIGRLYGEFSNNRIRQLLKIADMQEYDIQLLGQTLENARCYFFNHPYTKRYGLLPPPEFIKVTDLIDQGVQQELPQWEASTLKKVAAEGRPALVFNKIPSRSTYYQERDEGEGVGNKNQTSAVPEFKIRNLTDSERKILRDLRMEVAKEVAEMMEHMDKIAPLRKG